MSILDVSAEEITQLSDDLLADLLGRLIEAEARANGIPLRAVIHGGHDNAPDRGIDARVSSSEGPEHTDFFLRRTTVFQSKAESMSAKPLKNEMAPGGNPRPLFEELAAEGGAYVMFCGKDDCTEGMLRNRLIAMRSAVLSVKQSERLALDFYDASRIARWVNNTHAGVAVWLRDMLGQPLQGWRPHGPWSYPGAKKHLPYLTDQTSRAGFTFDKEAPQVSILDALARVRSELAQPGRSVRLVGLSGTGKTRLAEALFDDGVGKGALPTSDVIYGDVALVQVSPITVAEQLNAEGRRAIMIADNCPATVHGQVTNIISRPNSQISFLSIDYDVGEDQPESTLVLVLKEDSDELIRALLEQRAPGLPATDRDRIVEFSGGNSRIALVLVHSLEEGGSLAHLTNRELVRRLFQDDRLSTSDALIRCAEVASLVISYSVEPTEQDSDPEYYHLARVAGVLPGEMFRATSQFLDRGVGQQRGPWRAVLPHALAARLARQALARIPRSQLYEAFAESAPKRLALSFAKRMGQVDDHPEAQALARAFLAQDGPVGAVCADDEWGLEMLRALAPAAQEAALDVVERNLEADKGGALVREGSTTRYWIAKLLFHLAYERALFDRAASLLASVVKDEKKDNNVHRVRDIFEQLFFIVASGTLASPDQRLDFVEDLLASADDNLRLLGIDALSAALKRSVLPRTDPTRFGGQARSLGWHAETNEQIEQQFARAAKRLTSFAASDDPLAEQARSALADSVRELSDERFVHIVEEVGHAVRASGFWAAGWREICVRLHFNRQDMDNELRERLDRLEQSLSPKTLEERFEAFVLHPHWEFYTPVPKHEEDRNVDVRSEIERIALELKDEHVHLRGYIERATCPGQGEPALLGESLVAAGFDVDNLYAMGIEAWEAASPQARQIDFLFGVLLGTAKQDVEKAEGMLDRIAAHETLAGESVRLSRAVSPLSPRSLRRIIDSLRAGQVQPGSLVGLAGAASRRELPQAELAALLGELTERGQEGNAAAAHILANLQLGRTSAIDQLSPTLWAIGRRVVESEHLFYGTDVSRTYFAKVLAEAVLDHEVDPQLASTVVRNVRSAIEGGAWGDESLTDVMRFVARRYPEVFLSDECFMDRTGNVAWQFFIQKHDSDVRKTLHPIDYVEPGYLRAWVKGDPRGRAGRVAQVLTYATSSDGSAEMTWTSVALDLISIEETAVEVLKEFERRFYLGSWTGSEANRYARRRSLCEALQDHPNPKVSRWARKALRQIELAIQSAEKRERAESQSFE